VIVKKKKTTCAYCGNAKENITRDHVVPQALWKDLTKPDGIVTVPACRRCQEIWDMEATYFRNVLAAITPESHEAVKELFSGAIKRSVDRSKKEMFDLTRNARSTWQFNSGHYELRSGFDIDMGRFNLTPEKIVRGLLYYKNKKPLPPDYKVAILGASEFLAMPEIETLLMELDERWQCMGDDIFAVRSMRESDPNVTAWLFRFYGSAFLMGFTFKEKPR
jgi:hypothetical protein